MLTGYPQTAGSQIGANQTSRPTTQLERAYSEIERLCQRVGDLTGKINHAADRLYGAQPAANIAEERQCFNDGLSGRILDGLASLASQLSAAEAQADRLEV